MDSQGRISLDVDGQPDPANPSEPTAEDPFYFVRDYTPAGSDRRPSERPTTMPVEPDRAPASARAGGSPPPNLQAAPVAAVRGS